MIVFSLLGLLPVEVFQVNIIRILNSCTLRLFGMVFFVTLWELHVVPVWGFVCGHISFTFQLNVEWG